MGAVKEAMVEDIERIAHGIGKQSEMLQKEWDKQKWKKGFEEFLAEQTRRTKK